MRVVLPAVVAAGVLFGSVASAQTPAKADAKDTPAADRTRTQLLKVKVSGEFKNAPLREVLKEFAAQVDMQAERPVLWTYAEGVAAGQPVTFTCSNKPLDQVLGDLFTKLKLGYVVVSEDDHPRDGWVRVTSGTERGYPAALSSADDDDEKKAAARLGIAKELIAGGKPTDAKAVLMLVVNKFPKTKAAAEAKKLLEKLTP
jgi:hypothetical protein